MEQRKTSFTQTSDLQVNNKQATSQSQVNSDILVRWIDRPDRGVIPCFALWAQITHFPIIGYFFNKGGFLFLCLF